MSYANDLLKKECKAIDFSAKSSPTNNTERPQVPLQTPVRQARSAQVYLHSPRRAKFLCFFGPSKFLPLVREERLMPSGLQFVMPQEWRYFP
jgi:hypothetical protein